MAPWFFPLNRLKWQFSLFRNSYLEKITEITNLVPLPTPFNTTLAWTRGLESNLTLSFFNRRVEWETGLLFLNISDPRVFRFKPRQKITSDVWYRDRRWQFNLHIFAEGEQFALVPAFGQVGATTLPARWDIDLAAQRKIRLLHQEAFVNLALRNLRNSGRKQLRGLFLQDRRWYVSLGVQF